ncbi:hypothetical protein DMUE_3369 [Dictyocoela muelleri]|nr:hypothetical protein DMUE_3369 [Dictyocoela muelleri]
MSFWERKKWIECLRDVVYQYNTSVHRATSKSPFEVFRGLIIGDSSISNVQIYNNETLEHFNNYVSRIYKERKPSEIFNINDRVLLAKDFDNNVKTKKQPLNCNFYETIYYVCEITNTLVLIKKDCGEMIWTDPKRIKKIND